MNKCWQDQTEWLETDGLGGFASGTPGGIRTRRYHGLLTCATNPPTGRFVLVSGIEALVTTPHGTFPITTQRYDGQVVFPEGYKHLESFDCEPWPVWRYKLPDGTVLEHELFVRHGESMTVLSWRVIGDATGVTLSVRPLISGRDYHSLHHENPAFRFNAHEDGEQVIWHPYESVPRISARSNGVYTHEPLWYRTFFYQEEWLRGLDATEDLASPGRFDFDLSSGEAAMILSASSAKVPNERAGSLRARLAALRFMETRRRNAFQSPLARSGDQYIVRRRDGRTIIAGYPWFADWGRDTFISLRGLCLATGRLDDAHKVLAAWSKHVSMGMLPNRFPDQGEEPEYNSVDASLWFVIAVGEFFKAAEESDYLIPLETRGALTVAVERILAGYAAGTRHGIRMDEDGLLLAGEPGVQLTWMDAKVGEHVITPRHGKPVEVQALWLNALYMASSFSPKWEAIGRRGAMAFRRRFWNDGQQCLFDVVDDHRSPGATDARFRPNQIYAVGGLPLMLLDLAQARAVVDQVEERLLTPLGLRSLAPGEPGYYPRYTGGPAERDSAYHQGTVWPFLIGAFVEAWVRARGNTDDAKREARARFVEPLLKHLDESGLGHVSEIADGDAPHMPRGCPFQAWSIAELLRLELDVLKIRDLNPKQPAMHPKGVLSQQP